MTKQGHIDYASVFHYIYTHAINILQQVSGMQVEVKVYHICLADPNCRHG